MLFKQHTIPPRFPDSAFVYQLTDKEMQEHSTDIIHYGAVYNIKLKKEDTLMVEKLEAYRAELEAKKAEALAKDITPIIDEQVAIYRSELEANAKAELDSYVAKVDSDIDCIDAIIAREKATEAVAVEAEPEV
jgi:hypothetical protein